MSALRRPRRMLWTTKGRFDGEKAESGAQWCMYDDATFTPDWLLRKAMVALPSATLASTAHRVTRSPGRKSAWASLRSPSQYSVCPSTARVRNVGGVFVAGSSIHKLTSSPLVATSSPDVILTDDLAPDAEIGRAHV